MICRPSALPPSSNNPPSAVLQIRAPRNDFEWGGAGARGTVPESTSLAAHTPEYGGGGSGVGDAATEEERQLQQALHLSQLQLVEEEEARLA
eukprot:CAMPEP_0185758796 /NCGR_PEP_ID=MMETSP1174-20130828/17474_1 /TAXON_ID=35687 /ORGANISM="Dictyocha speculum, Strain CCMP1381" /LENGTH=91 /DNA_ID=CAMNT_0028438815 /DNA_START=152 /DNA_END=424 /DNA_ORIENTATION=-